jgi:glycosyltransferase 2 family protein
MLSLLRRSAPVLKWLLAIGLLVLLFWLNRDGLAQMRTREIGWSLFAAAIGVRFGSLCLTFLRWWLLVTGIGLPFTLKESFRLGLLGEACNFVMPGAAGGDLVKAVWLAKDTPGRRASAVATVLLDRVLGLWALFAAGAVASLLPIGTKPGPEMAWAVKVLWFGTIVGLIGIMLLLIPAVTRSRLMLWTTTWPVVGRIVRELIDSVSLYQGRPTAVIGAGLLSLLGHVGFLSSFYLCAMSLHGSLRPEAGQVIPGYVDHLVGLPLPEALSAAVPTPAGIGALEGALAWFYQQHQQAVQPDSTPQLLESARANGLLTALAYRMTALLVGACGVVFYLAAKKNLPVLDNPSSQLANT